YLGDAANEEVYCELRYQGQLYDAETGLYYNRHRYYDAESGQYLSPDPIGMLGGIRPQGYVHNPLEWVDPLGLVKVGRWMSPAEHQQMLETGKVVQSNTGTTHVAYPADVEAFGKQAKPGTVYAEFDVPEESLIKTNEGWAKIAGPDSLEGRLAKRKGQPVPEMPKAGNIEVKAKKTEKGIEKIC
ncbi:RHS repeat-associated core domain-containing protein, partial [Pectobacterium carotovorum]|uniref:RHS repeat-associated core domain-containing protein n=3 Tax=Pectobacterium carotovorum TaxID=554 RepID=UPI003017A0C5